MAERSETLTTDRGLDEAVRAGTTTLESLGLKVKEVGPGAIQGKAGSKFMIYWIGLIAPQSMVPVRVDYTVTDDGGKRTVQMHTKSSVPLSFYVWKYKKRAGNISDAVKQGVAAKLGQSVAAPVA